MTSRVVKQEMRVFQSFAWATLWTALTSLSAAGSLLFITTQLPATKFALVCFAQLLVTYILFIVSEAGRPAMVAFAIDEPHDIRSIIRTYWTMSGGASLVASIGIGSITLLYHESLEQLSVILVFAVGMLIVACSPFSDPVVMRV